MFFVFGVRQNIVHPLSTNGLGMRQMRAGLDNHMQLGSPSGAHRLITWRFRTFQRSGNSIPELLSGPLTLS